ncbi:hypothetical protein [Staphylococcus equorum]|uniref:hypothetical protein n=1 Tax=Staphylococcus equorum TaxID=246432 RepID=UPI003EB72375
MEVLKALGAIVPIGTTIYFIIKGTMKYLKDNPESKLRIYGQSIIGSFASYMVVNIIALIYYYFIILNSSYDSKLLELISILIVATAGIITSVLFLFKDWYKRKNAFIIAEDNKLFEKDRKHFNQYAKTISEIIAYDYINGSLNCKVKINEINKKRSNKHRLHKEATIYNILSIITSFAFPLLALNMFLLIYDQNKNDFTISVTIISIIFMFINSFVIYFDYKLQYGIVDQTDTMLKKHDKKYRKIVKKQDKKNSKKTR